MVAGDQGRQRQGGLIRGLISAKPNADLSSATDRAGDALGQCEIPLGPKNWLVRLNHQRSVQLGHSSYKFTAGAAPSPTPPQKQTLGRPRLPSPDFPSNFFPFTFFLPTPTSLPTPP